MSELIDNLIRMRETVTDIEGEWVIAKPYRLYGIRGFISRLKDAYRVLIDKSRAYHFYQDEVKIK